MDVPTPPLSANREAALLRKKKAKRNVIILSSVLVVIAAAVLYVEKFSSLPFQAIASFESSVSSQVQSDFSSYPNPLKMFAGAPKKTAPLTIKGVITQTNIQRDQNGALPALAENKTLDDIALLRLDDMFQNDYFAHVSPTGESAATVASSVGYVHLSLGENLAFGTFLGDNGVVTAWMNSPGHRANILNTHYREIGVAVRQGTLNGQSGWLAVQIFGRPTSDCTAPDPNTKAMIDSAESNIATMSTELQKEKAAIDAMQPQSGSDYNAKVEQYNALAAQYNTFTAQTKAQISVYNAAVDAFNACLAS